MAEIFYFPTILRPDGSSFSVEAKTQEEAQAKVEEFLQTRDNIETNTNQEKDKPKKTLEK